MADKTYHEHLLCVIPFPEPKEVVNRIQKCHPDLKVTFIKSTLPQNGKQAHNVPSGNEPGHA